MDCDFAESANNVKLTVRPNKIVAGHEPIKTNEFLQALAFALEKQVETGSVKKTLRKSKPTKPEGKEVDVVKRKNTINRAPSKEKADVGSDTVKKEPSKKKSSEKKPADADTRKKPSKVVKKSEEKREIDNLIEKNVPLTNGVETSQEVVLEENTSQLQKPDSNLDDVDSVKLNRPPSAKLKKRTPSAKPTENKSKEDKSKEDKSKEPSGDDADSNEVLDRVLGGVVNDIQGEPKSADPPIAANLPSTSPVPLATPSALKPAEPAPSEKNLARLKSGAQSKEPVAVARPRTAIRAPSARPASARPAAPRVRDRGQVPLQEDVTPAVGKVNLIVEKDAGQDDEELVSVKAEQDNNFELPVDPSSTSVNDESNTEHGQLVSQILEAQKELEESAFAKKNSPGPTEIEWGGSRSIDGTRREVDRLRTAVQTLTRGANPLGKLLEYLQEDVDSMQQELSSWKQRNANLATKLDQERSLTDKSTEPLKIHLEELDHNIRQELEQIGVLKATVLRNDERIKRLLLG